MIAMRLSRTAAIPRLLSASGDILTGREHHLPAVLPLGSLQPLRRLLVDEQLAALHAHTSQNLEDHFVKLNIIDGAGQLVMTEMARTAMIVETARLAELAVFEDSHALIGEPIDLPFLRAMGLDLHYGASCDFVGSKHPELDAHNGLCLRTVRKIWHT